MPPPVSGSGARRVQSTAPSAAGSPDATPSVNGEVWKRRRSIRVWASPDRTATSDMPPARNERRLNTRALSGTILPSTHGESADIFFRG